MADFDPADVAQTARALRATLDAIDRGEADTASVRSSLETAVIELESFTGGNP